MTSLPAKQIAGPCIVCDKKVFLGKVHTTCAKKLAREAVASDPEEQHLQTTFARALLAKGKAR